MNRSSTEITLERFVTVAECLASKAESVPREDCHPALSRYLSEHRMSSVGAMVANLTHRCRLSGLHHRHRPINPLNPIMRKFGWYVVGGGIAQSDDLCGSSPLLAGKLVSDNEDISECFDVFGTDATLVVTPAIAVLICVLTELRILSEQLSGEVFNGGRDVRAVTTQLAESAIKAWFVHFMWAVDDLLDEEVADEIIDGCVALMDSLFKSRSYSTSGALSESRLRTQNHLFPTFDVFSIFYEFPTQLPADSTIDHVLSIVPEQMDAFLPIHTHCQQLFKMQGPWKFGGLLILSDQNLFCLERATLDIS